jgi:hypothetical protein
MESIFNFNQPDVSGLSELSTNSQQFVCPIFATTLLTMILTCSVQITGRPVLHPVNLVAAESSSFITTSSCSAHPHSLNSSVHSVPIPSFVGYPGLPYILHPSVGQVAAMTVAQIVGDLHSGPLDSLQQQKCKCRMRTQH